MLGADIWEPIAITAGAICVALVALERPSNFAFSIVSCGAFIVVFVEVGLYAQAALQVVFIGLSMMGWWWWIRPDDGGQGLRVRRAGRAELAGCVLAVGASTAVIAGILHGYTDSRSVFSDSLTASSSLVAQFMLGRKWVENWMLWIGTDLVYIWLFWTSDLHLTSALYVVFLGLAIAGLAAWSRSMSRVREPQTT